MALSNDSKDVNIIKLNDDFKANDDNINLDNVKKIYNKNPGRVTAGKKLAEHNRLKKLEIKKPSFNYYYIAIPSVVLILYFIFKKDDSIYNDEKLSDNKKISKKREIVFEI